MDSVLVFVPIEIEHEDVVAIFEHAVDWESWSPSGGVSTCGRVYLDDTYSFSDDVSFLDFPEALEKIQSLKTGDTSNWLFHYSLGTVAMHDVLVALVSQWPQIVLHIDGYAAPMLGTDFLVCVTETGGWKWREDPQLGFEERRQDLPSGDDR